MTNVRSILLASAAAVITGLAATTYAQAADQLLSGAIASTSGEKLGGVTVSAKLEGATITTSVYTDETGNYYFPPLTAMTDPERRWRQLPGELMMAALPEDTVEDAQIKKIFTNNCNGCHAPNY